MVGSILVVGGAILLGNFFVKKSDTLNTKQDSQFWEEFVIVEKCSVVWLPCKRYEDGSIMEEDAVSCKSLGIDSSRTVNQYCFTSFWIHFPAWEGFWQDPSREKRNMNAANSFWTNSSCLNQLISDYQRYLTVCIRKVKLWHAPGERNCFCKDLAAFSSVGSCAVYLIRKGFK